MDLIERSVISALTRDHRQIEERLARLQGATDPEERRRLLGEVTTEIVQHADAEDRYLYRVVREAIPRGAIDIAVDVEKQIEAHAKVKAMVEGLERIDVTGGEFERLVTELAAEIHQNIVDEEHSVFAWLVQWVDESTLAELGDEVQTLRN